MGILFVAAAVLTDLIMQVFTPVCCLWYDQNMSWFFFFWLYKIQDYTRNSIFKSVEGFHFQVQSISSRELKETFKHYLHLLNLYQPCSLNVLISCRSVLSIWILTNCRAVQYPSRVWLEPEYTAGTGPKIPVSVNRKRKWFWKLGSGYTNWNWCAQIWNSGSGWVWTHSGHSQDNPEKGFINNNR